MMPLTKLIFISFFLFGCTNSNNKTFSSNEHSLDSINVVQKATSKARKFELEKPSFKRHLTKSDNPFLLLNFDKVVAYDYEGRNGETYLEIIDSNGILANTVTKEKELTQSQIYRLNHVLGNNSTYGNAYAECFDPHLGVLFFNKNKVVVSVSICLECNHLISSIEIPAMSFEKIEISNSYSYPAEGFSKTGKQKINSLCKEFCFDHSKD